MNQKQPSVSDIFRRAQVLHQEHLDWSYEQLKDSLVKEFSGGELPPLYNLTIPEQDARAPQEDWSAGLPLVRRGIQFNDWNEIAEGIVLSLEQTENYEKEHGAEGDRDEWHDRSVGIDEAEEKGVSKWMPDELRQLIESQKK
jgi:hypothetical protein